MVEILWGKVLYYGFIGGGIFSAFCFVVGFPIYWFGDRIQKQKTKQYIAEAEAWLAEVKKDTVRMALGKDGKYEVLKTMKEQGIEITPQMVEEFEKQIKEAD